MTNIRTGALAGAASPTDLGGGRLFRLGSAFPADERVSWLPATARGWQASNAYVLVQDEAHTLIDPGLRYHADALISQLAGIVPERVPLTVVLTRSERDSAGCLRDVARAFPLDRLYAMGTPNMFDGFEAAVTENLAGGAHGDLQRLPSGDVEIAPGRTLVGIAPVFRLLSTYWFYDAATRSLFTSDAFGFLLGDSPEEAQRPMTIAEKWPDVQAVREDVLAKFWWFEDSHVSVILRNLEAIFEEYDVEQICPAHGRVIDGADAVKRAVALYRDVLRQLQSESAAERNGE